MPALPPSSDFTGASVTEGAFKTAITNLRDYLSGLMGADGTIATAQSTLGMLGGSVAAKSAAYTVVAADRGKVFNCTTTFTLSLTAAATLGSGFSFIVANIGTGLITIDPNSSELINGAATITVSPGEQVMVTGNGTAWRAFSGFDLGNLTADTAPDTAADYAIVWDASLATWKKVLIDNLGGGGMKLIASGSLSGTSTTISSIPATYKDLRLLLKGASISGNISTTGSISMRFNGSTTNYDDSGVFTPIGAGSGLSSTDVLTIAVDIPDYAGSAGKIASSVYGISRGGGMKSSYWNNAGAINQISVSPTTSTSWAQSSFDAGTYELYGIK
jgi:hypothetical protein